MTLGDADVIQALGFLMPLSKMPMPYTIEALEGMSTLTNLR